MTLKAITAQEFGRRLHSLLIQKGWNQSDLARATDIGKASISGYIKGRSFPRPERLDKIAAALELAKEKLLPNSLQVDGGEEQPSIEIGDGNRVRLRINRWMSFATAAKIMAEIGEDEKDGAD